MVELVGLCRSAASRMLGSSSPGTEYPGFDIASDLVADLQIPGHDPGLYQHGETTAARYEPGAEMTSSRDRPLLGSAPFCSHTEGGSRGPQTL
jgi:hypothetical protein